MSSEDDKNNGQDLSNNTPMPETQEKPSQRRGFTIYSWNINGIRTLDMKSVLEQLKADIVAVQETKIARNQLDSNTAFINECTSYFSFCRGKSGYSGVATYCVKEFTPSKANEGLINDEVDLNELAIVPEASEDGKKLYCVDTEGRCVITEHIVEKPDGRQVPLAIINVYCPRLRCDPEDTMDNTDSKMIFHDLIMKRAEMFVNSGAFVLIVGDFNISHKPLDHVEGAEGIQEKSIFCGKLDELLETTFKDTFRSLHPERLNAFTCWNSKTNARQNNYGTRLDYIVADHKLMKYLESAEIHPEIIGSDHCPISATFRDLVPVPSQKIPAFATKFYPELTGIQKKIHDFFQKAPKRTPTESTIPTMRKSKARQLNMSDYIVKKPKLDQLALATATNETDTCVEESQSSTSLVVEPARVQDQNSSSKQTPSQDKAGANFWKQLMKPQETPRCTGHDELCAKKTVKKKGPTCGRQFWSCPRGVGARTDPNANCGFFKWC